MKERVVRTMEGTGERAARRLLFVERCAHTARAGNEAPTPRASRQAKTKTSDRLSLSSIHIKQERAADRATYTCV
jgi:hypothetical protein